MLQRIDRAVEKGLDEWLPSIAGVLLILFTMAIFAEVIKRYAFGVTHYQVVEYSTVFFLWISLLLAGKVTKEGRHISIDFLLLKLSEAGKSKLKAAFYIYINVAVLVFCAMWLYCGILDTAAFYASGFRSTVPYSPPFWIKHLCIPVGIVFLIYYGIKELIKSMRYFKKISAEK